MQYSQKKAFNNIVYILNCFLYICCRIGSPTLFRVRRLKGNQVRNLDSPAAVSSKKALDINSLPLFPEGTGRKF